MDEQSGKVGSAGHCHAAFVLFCQNVATTQQALAGQTRYCLANDSTLHSADKCGRTRQASQLGSQMVVQLCPSPTAVQ